MLYSIIITKDSLEIQIFFSKTFVHIFTEIPFNQIQISADIYSDWRKAIPKPGKAPANPTNYRPFALRSCICRCWILYTTRVLGAFRTSLVESVYVDAHEPSLGTRRVKLSLQNASKFKSVRKHPTNDAVFRNKYTKLFDTRPYANCTFGLRIKYFLTASNILEKPYFVLPLRRLYWI